MTKNWLLADEKTDKLVKDSLKESLGISSVLATILVQRGITTFDEAKTFFRPQLTDLHDPFLMKDMDVAIQRITKAIETDEKILIYGDYDVDGTTAVALVFSFFSSFYANLDYYIPDRYAEGYGVSFQSIDFADENGFSLIIALDCGIKATDKVAYANEKGVDYIICDHHRPGEKLPEAVAILDPKRTDCSYPYDELCGCGIGFKLIQAFSEKKGLPFESLYPYLDLTAISIGCDIVPVTGENRILAHYGLIEINKNPRIGIQAMLQLIEVKKALTITDLVFLIGPRINAAGRIDTGKKAVSLLISKDKKSAVEIGKRINEDNTFRKELDKNITQEALEMIAENATFLKAKSTVLFQENWHKGVIGIVASRVIESYYKPTIILTKSGDVAAGSARSVSGFDVYNAIDKCADLLTQFGGHKYAAGMTMPIENITAFREKFDRIVSESITEEQLIPQIKIDSEINFEEITPKFYRILKQMSPFGPQNMHPTFMTSDVVDTGFSKTVGADDLHLKLNVFQEKNRAIKLNGIAFNLGHLYPEISSKKPFKIVYTIEENEWQGNVTLQLKIKDIQF